MLLQEGDRCELFPHIGGSIGSWTVQGQHMLRAVSATNAAAQNPYGMASFPLVPYSNRIGAATFHWRGQEINLRRNYLPERHAIHGVGHERPWQVQRHTSNCAVLSLRHAGDNSWPWAFEARQTFTLAKGALTLNLAVTNLEAFPVPLAFGHHPYFPRDGAQLRFQANGVWLVSDDKLPSSHVNISDEFDFSDSVAIETRALDNCFTGWHGPAQIDWREQPLALEIEASTVLSNAVVFISSVVDGFCFEPVPHINNALNLAGHEASMPVIDPGDSFNAQIHFRTLRR